MNNYYEYCKNISKPYYPKIYRDINYHIGLELRDMDNDKLHPFPRGNEFEVIVDNIFNRYKKSIYNKIINGEPFYANYTNEDLVTLTKDLIRILLIQRIINDRVKFSDYPFYY